MKSSTSKKSSTILEEKNSLRSNVKKKKGKKKLKNQVHAVAKSENDNKMSLPRFRNKFALLDGVISNSSKHIEMLKKLSRQDLVALFDSLDKRPDGLIAVTKIFADQIVNATPKQALVAVKCLQIIMRRQKCAILRSSQLRDILIQLQNDLFLANSTLSQLQSINAKLQAFQCLAQNNLLNQVNDDDSNMEEDVYIYRDDSDSEISDTIDKSLKDSEDEFHDQKDNSQLSSAEEDLGVFDVDSGSGESSDVSRDEDNESNQESRGTEEDQSEDIQYDEENTSDAL